VHLLGVVDDFQIVFQYSLLSFWVADRRFVPLQSIPTGLQARPQGTDLADNSLGGVECTAYHPGSRGCGRHCVSHNAPVEYKKTLQLLFPPEQAC